MAEMTAAAINDLPDSAFAYIEPGGTKVDGKTEPRSLRHFPINDEAHVRNALARLSQSPFGDKARAKVEAAAKRMGIGEQKAETMHEPAAAKLKTAISLHRAHMNGTEPTSESSQKRLMELLVAALAALDPKAETMKALGELKAEPMDMPQLDRWLSGRIPRRILMLPFGGPLPGGKAGLDLDGEYFDEGTDIYGPYPTLRASRERLVDWHHDADPTGRMKGAIIGHLQFDAEPEQDGYWADFWANAGEKRRQLVALLERRGVPLFGSTEAVKGARVMWPPEEDGHIPVWPVTRHTISTSPQNTLAVVPALKAALTASAFDELPAEAIKAMLLGLDASTAELLLSSSDAAVTASALAGEEAVTTAAEVIEAVTEALGGALTYAYDQIRRSR